jgi:hypothetical protein
MNNKSEGLKYNVAFHEIPDRLHSLSRDSQVVLFVSFNDDYQMLDEMETLIRKCHIGKFPFLEIKCFDIIAKEFFAVQDRKSFSVYLSANLENSRVQKVSVTNG